MRTKREGQREAGEITSCSMGADEDWGFITSWVQVDFHGSTQGFGGITMDDKMLAAWRAELLGCFGVKDPKDLVGKKCRALRCWGGFNDTIEGLESYDTGRVLTKTAFLRRHVKNPMEVKTPIEYKKQSLRRHFEMLSRQLADCFHDLDTLHEDYVEWEER